jgi:uncharacterized protein YndB with AHSA1/START domain
MTGRSAIEVDQFLPHPPARVWRALTDPQQLARWLMPNTFQPHVGHKFTLDAGEHGQTRCEVLALEPEQLIRISWQNDTLDTVVTWRLAPEGTGTRLMLEHTGFDSSDAAQNSALDAMDRGWNGSIMRALEKTLASSPVQPERLARGSTRRGS